MCLLVYQRQAQNAKDYRDPISLCLGSMKQEHLMIDIDAGDDCNRTPVLWSVMTLQDR